MNKTAKEMFEELGYKYEKIGEKIYYEEPNLYELGGHSPCIVFYTVNRYWDTNIVNIEKDKKIMKAINKQVAELGWNNE